jgi:hypothetical protein
MWKAGIGLFADRTLKANNFYTKYLIEGDNKSGIMSMTMEHTYITAAFTTIYVINNTGISRNKVFGYIVKKFGNNYHDGIFERGKPKLLLVIGFPLFPFEKIAD